MSHVTEAELLYATARAASLDDRLEGARMVPCDPAVVAERLSRWRDHASDGDESEFATYLAEIGLQPAQAAELMGDVAVPGADAAPPWTHVLGDIVRRARSGDHAGDPIGIPFGHLWTAVAASARDAVSGTLDPAHRRLLGPDVLDGVVQDLLHDVGRLGAAAIYEAFSERRRRLREAGAVNERAYDDFVEEERSAGLPVLVRRYPVLGRLVAHRVIELASATGELLSRLHADRRALLGRFWPDGDPGRVTSITFGLGDRHRSGRTVARVEFERGPTIVYKPRPVRAEHALGILFAAIEDAGLAAPLAPQVLDRGAYGWAGWVHRRECGDAGQLAEYYTRAGTLLALAWVLGSTDLHAENIVAAGTGPAVVDGEMISPPRLAPRLLARPDLPEPADARVAEMLQESVATVGLLPTWFGTNRDNARDVSGLTGTHAVGGIAWMGMNTAHMVPVLDPLPVGRSCNAPTGGDIAASAAAGLDALLDGYATADSWLEPHRHRVKDLVTASGLLTAEARITFRTTTAYAVIARRAMSPSLLGHGLDRSLALDAVSRQRWWPPAFVNLHATDPLGARRITAAERRALERADIPLFLARPTQTDLVVDGATVAGVFSGRPETVLQDRLGRIGSRHTQDQVVLARGTFEALRLRRKLQDRRQTSSVGAPSVSLDRGARRLAALVTEQAVRAGSSVSWTVIDEDDRIGSAVLRPIKTDLYGGRAGLAVFLAAGAVHWGDEELAQLAADCLRPVAETARCASLEDLGGGLRGTSSAIYGMAVAAELLCDSSLARAAQQAAARMETLIGQQEDGLHDGPLGAGDASRGLFGAALALAGASMHGAGAPAARAAATIVRRVLAGDDLDAAGLANLCQAADQDGPADAGLRLGIAHGVSGVALALHRVSAAVHEPALAGAAGTVLDLTETILAAAPGGIERLDGGWCRGTAGIAAAAIAMGDRCHTPFWRCAITLATRRARDAAPLTGASVCCGQGGAAELLTLAGEERAARAVAASLIPPTEHGWSLGLQPGVAPLLPGFHQGAAGLGYTLLRALSPARLPSILVWG